MENVVKTAGAFAGEVESQSLNFLVAGFSFASAIAWMDVVRWIISNIVKVNKSGGTYYILTALLTTLLAIVVYMAGRKVSKKVVRPDKPMFAIVS